MWLVAWLGRERGNDSQRVEHACDKGFLKLLAHHVADECGAALEHQARATVPHADASHPVPHGIAVESAVRCYGDRVAGVVLQLMRKPGLTGRIDTFDERAGQCRNAAGAFAPGQGDGRLGCQQALGFHRRMRAQGLQPAGKAA